MEKTGVNYKVQDQEFVTDEEIKAFMTRFDHILCHKVSVYFLGV